MATMAMTMRWRPQHCDQYGRRRWWHTDNQAEDGDINTHSNAGKNITNKETEGDEDSRTESQDTGEETEDTRQHRATLKVKEMETATLKIIEALSANKKEQSWSPYINKRTKYVQDNIQE